MQCSKLGRTFVFFNDYAFLRQNVHIRFDASRGCGSLPGGCSLEPNNWDDLINWTGEEKAKINFPRVTISLHARRSIFVPSTFGKPLNDWSDSLLEVFGFQPFLLQ
jgi:hypothetical protein